MIDDAQETKAPGNPRLPLDGVRVLDLTQVVSGPVATMMLGDLGAQVIKVEPPGGEAYRISGPIARGENGETILNSVRFSRNKQSVVLDLKTEGGRTVLRDLIAVSDVLVENFRPGVMTRLGFSPDDIKAINSRIVYASISGFGHDDVVPASRNGLPAYALVVEAMAGLTHLAGDESGPPAWMGFAMADIFAGTLAVAGIAIALLDRERGGQGQRVDIAMADGALLMNELAMLSSAAVGQVLGRGQYAYQAPWGVFQARDGYVAIAVMTLAQWKDLCKLIGRSELGERADLATGVLRTKHMRDVITPAIEFWTSSRSATDVADALNGVRVPASRVNTSADLINDPGFLAREMLIDVQDPVLGTVRAVGNPIKLAGGGQRRTGVLPALGEHTHDVLTEVLGYTPERLRALRVDAAIGGE